MHITMKPAKMCPKGGSGCPSSINTGVQLKTKMNMEDSKRQPKLLFLHLTDLTCTTSDTPGRRIQSKAGLPPLAQQISSNVKLLRLHDVSLRQNLWKTVSRHRLSCAAPKRPSSCLSSESCKRSAFNLTAQPWWSHSSPTTWTSSRRGR